MNSINLNNDAYLDEIYGEHYGYKTHAHREYEEQCTMNDYNDDYNTLEEEKAMTNLNEVRDMYVRDNYESMTVKELRVIAKDKELKGYNSLTKHGLISMIMAATKLEDIEPVGSVDILDTTTGVVETSALYDYNAINPMMKEEEEEMLRVEIKLVEGMSVLVFIDSKGNEVNAPSNLDLTAVNKQLAKTQTVMKSYREALAVRKTELTPKEEKVAQPFIKPETKPVVDGKKVVGRCACGCNITHDNKEFSLKRDVVGLFMKRIAVIGKTDKVKAYFRDRVRAGELCYYCQHRLMTEGKIFSEADTVNNKHYKVNKYDWKAALSEVNRARGEGASI